MTSEPPHFVQCTSLSKEESLGISRSKTCRHCLHKNRCSILDTSLCPTIQGNFRVHHAKLPLCVSFQVTYTDFHPVKLPLHRFSLTLQEV